MDLSKVQYFEKIESTGQREYMNSHNNCILCRSALELQHIRTDNSGEIKEEARCPQCDLKTRAKVFTVH